MKQEGVTVVQPSSTTWSGTNEAQKGSDKQSAVSADVCDNINGRSHCTSSCLYVNLQSPSISKPAHGVCVTGCNGFHDVIAPTHIADVNDDDEFNITPSPRRTRLVAVGRRCLRSINSTMKPDRVPLCSSVSAVDGSRVYSNEK